MVKKILSIALWVITGAALIVLFVFGRKWYLETPLKGVCVTIERRHATGFIENDSLTARIQTLCDMEHQAAIATIDMTKLSQMLDNNLWIAHSNIYIDLNDTLRVTVKEYEPALRVYNRDGRSVYVTYDGFIIPTNPHYTPHTIIASGNYNFAMPVKNSNIADSLYMNAGLAEALVIAKAIEKDDFLKEHIGQIYRNADNEYELIVNNLPIQVILGDTYMVSNKLQRLKTLLEKYLGTEEMEAYKTMSLKYKNQIVCTKNKNHE